MFDRLVKPFAPRSQPWITRQSYTYELRNALTYPIAIAMVEGGVVGILAAKAFNVAPWQFAMIMAAPMFANMTSFIWAFLARGKRKIAAINVLQVTTLLCVAGIALLPGGGGEHHPLGAMLLTVLVVLSRCLLSGVVTLRSTVWRMNYPRNVRAQVTGRLALINSLILGFAPLLGYFLLDLRDDAFRVVYPLSAGLALLGVFSFSHVRLRGERELLRYEQTPTARPLPHGLPGPIYEYDPKQARTERNDKPNFWAVLKQDHFFRSYMIWQFVAGAANMTSEVVIIYIIAELTAELPVEYMLSILLSTAIPMSLAVATMPLWARQLDSMHVAQFRARQGWYWITNQLANWVAAFLAFGVSGSLWAAMAVLIGARAIQGITRGAGMLAWNLGHNDFADRRLVGTYMGIHVTLTGVRGAIVPFVGMALYAGWPEITLPGTAWILLPSFGGIGYHVFLVTAAGAMAAEFGFKSLHRAIVRENHGGVPGD
ncbi:MFS transporter [Phycisphaerales bacterium AB-hyl4]|uniref:MFS transporter n=1 Tax=Natronomicrosphaera hydrolytica TaxID=3242702 RepID=A0ABV4U780_9BACT